MSKKEEALQHHERLNIATLTISNVKRVIKQNIINTIKCWEDNIPIEKQTFHIIGPAGVGKTEIIYQICNELTTELFPSGTNKFDIIKVNAPVLSRDDFIIPFPVIDNGNTSFKMLYSDFVPKKEDSYGIFVIDEFSRGDHALQQLMWQVQNECKLHLMDFPKGWFVVSIDNPDDQEYTMDYLEDAAGLRRMLHIYTEVNAIDFINYAIEKGFHPAVVEYIQTHPNYLYDFKSQKIGSVYANPASWERVSNILKGYDKNGGIRNNLQEIEILCSGLLNTNMTRLFMDFLRDMKDISPRDIVHNYSKVRKDIIGFVRDQNNAKLGEIMNSFLTYLTTTFPEYGKNEKKNIVELLTTIPIDTAALFITQINTLSKSSKEFRYMTELHRVLKKESRDYWNDFYQKIVTASNE